MFEARGDPRCAAHAGACSRGQKRKPPQSVAFERVGRGQVDRELGLQSRECAAQTPFQRFETFGVAGPVGQFDIEIACLFAKKEMSYPRGCKS